MKKEKENMVTVDEKGIEKELMEKIDLHDKLTNGYIHKSGIKVSASFNKNGCDVTDCWRTYLKERLKTN